MPFKDVLAIVVMALALLAAIMFLTIALTGCDETQDDDDDDTATDADTDADSDTDVDTGSDWEDVEPGCTAEFLGFDQCDCRAASMCPYEHTISYAPPCYDSDPNDFVPISCCCWDYAS